MFVAGVDQVADEDGPRVRISIYRESPCATSNSVAEMPERCFELGGAATDAADDVVTRGTDVAVPPLDRAEVVSTRYHRLMGMTLRTTDEQTEALRRQAVAEGRSMQAVALSAIDEYIARRAHKARVEVALDRVVAEEAGVLERLRDA